MNIDITTKNFKRKLDDFNINKIFYNSKISLKF